VQILDFDTFDMEHLVLYNNDSTIEVFDLEKGVEYTHRMRLPKYKKFENYVFKTYPGMPRPKREYFEKTLALLMTNPEDNKVVYIVYRLEESQHNSLYISNHSISDQISNSNFSWIVLTGDQEDVSTHYLGVVADKTF
jgi:hypothetical protein